MNTPNNTNSVAPEPLTPEERTLAARLAQLGPHGTPAPALDARIIAAAHAVGHGQARARQRRWPALIGLAATLALAFGLTWQMQPGVGVASRDAPPRERASAIVAETAVDRAERTGPAGEPPPRPADDVAQRQEAAPMRMPGPAATEQDKAPAAVPGRAKAAASAVAMPPPPAQPQSAVLAAPPSHVAAEPGIDAPAPAPALPETMTRRMPESRAGANAAAAPMDSAAAVASGDLAEVPVADDRELELADWIDRIRLRRDAGDLVGARESLQLLRRTYPQAVLPDDLRELADGHLDQR